MLKSMAPGQTVELILYNDGRFRTVKLRLASAAEVFPNAPIVNPLVPQIEAAVSKNDYKTARELCKRIPDDVVLESSMACLAAYKVRYDYKALRRAVDGLEIRCHNCLSSVYAQSWEYSPTTTAGIQANAKVVKMMAQYSQTEQNFLDKMDRDFSNSVSDLDPKDALTKFAQFARNEGSCRDVPPSQKLIETMVQFARQNNLPVPDDARAKADTARRMESRADDPATRAAAFRLWNSVLWMAPWWSEPYVSTSSLLDKLGRPQEAAVVSKLALMVPIAPAGATLKPATAALADAEPPSQESLLKCVGALEATEKGSEAERRTLNRCAAIAGKLDTIPAIPEEARRHFARGEAALELAQSPSDFQDAATEFEAALRQAPWWAEAHCDLGQVFEKAAKYQNAMLAYQGCLAASPNAPNVQDTQKKIYKMEFAADREQKQAINAQVQQRDSALRLQSLAGVWINKDSGNPYSAIIQDGLFIARRTPPSDRTNKFQGDYVIKGAVNGDKIEGTFTEPPIYNTYNGCTTPVSEMGLSGTISPDGKTMTIKYQSATYEPHGIRGNLFNPPKCTQVIKIGEQTVMMVLQKQD
jgi:tetratricopeptide (TPR) repeat protein